MAERIRVPRVAEITGLSIRSVQIKAIRGEIPSAAQFGRSWTFNERAVREWVAAKEKETVQKAEWARNLMSGFRAPTIRPNALSRSRFEEAYDRMFYPKGRDNPIYHRRRRKKQAP
jgi:predicted DNA-binding transcriptional regulator AlpA